MAFDFCFAGLFCLSNILRSTDDYKINRRNPFPSSIVIFFHDSKHAASILTFACALAKYNTTVTRHIMKPKLWCVSHQVDHTVSVMFSGSTEQANFQLPLYKPGFLMVHSSVPVQKRPRNSVVETASHEKKTSSKHLCSCATTNVQSRPGQVHKGIKDGQGICTKMPNTHTRAHLPPSSSTL